MINLKNEIEFKADQLKKEWGLNFDKTDFRSGCDFMTDLILKEMENWCAINAYDSDRGVCDRHTVDDSRGVVCSAEELLETIKLLVRK